MRGEDEEEKEKVRNEAGEFKKRNVEEKFSLSSSLSEKKSREKN